MNTYINSEVSDSKIKVLIKLLNKEIKLYEADEEYEICLELQTMIAKLSDFILGYCTYKEISDMIYDIAKTHGTIEVLNESNNTYKVVFNIKDYAFGFEVNEKEYTKLIDIQIEQVQNFSK